MSVKRKSAEWNLLVGKKQKAAETWNNLIFNALNMPGTVCQAGWFYIFCNSDGRLQGFVQEM